MMRVFHWHESHLKSMRSDQFFYFFFIVREQHIATYLLTKIKQALVFNLMMAVESFAGSLATGCIGL